MKRISILGSLRRTDLDLVFDWSPSPSISQMNNKRFTTNHTTMSLFSYSSSNYSRWCLLNFFFASLIYVLREPSIFWSFSKVFSLLYSLAIGLNVIQWSLMYGSLQLLLKNISFNTMDSRYGVGYLLANQPYTTFFLYLLLEFLIYISSMTFYYYAYVRFQSHQKSSCYDRCANYCPSLIAIIILLLYTACKMPLVHDIFLLYIQTRIRLLFFTFVFEVFHVLIILILWIFLTTKSNWNIQRSVASKGKTPLNVILNNTSNNNGPSSTLVPAPSASAASLPNLHRDDPAAEAKAVEKPYEKIRIFQSEIYYQNRPKNWSLPLNQQPSVIAAFDTDDDIILRSPSSPVHLNQNNPPEVQYRSAVRKNIPNVYQEPRPVSQQTGTSQQQTKAVFLRTETPPAPPVKRFTKEQVEAARLRAEHIFLEQQKQQQQSQKHQFQSSTPEYIPHRHSAALLISQV